MRRWLRLIFVLLVGYLAGAFISTLLLATWSVFSPLPHGVSHGSFPALGGLIGAGITVLISLAPARPREGPSTHGSARFAWPAEVRKSLGGNEGLIVGRSVNGGRGGGLLRYAGASHLLTIAPTRSGKGVGAIIPNLLLQDRSILCIDPKGENARITAKARERFGPVWVLDPFGVSGHLSASLNPLDMLDPGSLDLAEDAALVAEALVYDPPHQAGEAHWNEEAKALITGVILHMSTSAASNQRTLTMVRDLLTRSPDAMFALLGEMQASQAAGGLVARAANRQLGKSEREAAGVLSSAQRHTHFLDSPRMAGVLARSAFKFEDLKAQVATVFLVLPPERLATHARWLRLLVVQALNALARGGPREAANPVLFLLDEFAALGRLEAVERAYGLMAGYGVQLWAILQDLHQLRGAYGQQAGTFLSNAGLIQVFNVADVEMASWVSRSLGSTTEVFQTKGASASHDPMRWLPSKSTSTTVHQARRELMTPDEVMRLDLGLELLLQPGLAPVIARKVRYYEEGEFRSSAD